jgi:hypothetical protein
VQLLTVGELLDGKRIDYPAANVTYKKAQPAAAAGGEELTLPFEE